MLDWQSLIVLTNNHNEEVRVSILRLMHAYLERAPNSLKHSLIKNRGFLLLANQLYQFKTTSRLIEARDPRTARDRQDDRFDRFWPLDPELKLH